MNSPWGSRGEICRTFGWTYEYLLWGISWLNVNMMMADCPRIDTSEKGVSEEPVERIELKTKDDIRKFINGE